VEDRDPIKQLQHLLDDPGKVLERISRIQSALASINTPGAKAPPATAPPAEAGSIAQTEATYRGLLQTIRDMRLQIEQRLRPLAVQAVQAETDRLREWMKLEQRALDECVARIDRSLLACVKRIHESQEKHTELSALKARLEGLGVSSSSLPELSTSQDPGEIITDRLESLRRDGKF
jgi:uncharacterized protein YukE